MGCVLTLTLAGPLQSYGLRARWTVRDTATEPTKSAVIGLLARCLGRETDEGVSTLSASLRVGVRVDREGVPMTDYHTVGADGGYVTAKREPREGTIETYRDYLCDARFTVAVEGAEGLLRDCAEALRGPAAVPFLGRKACVPTEPLAGALVEAEGLEDALRRAPVITRPFEAKPSRLRAMIEIADVSEGDGGLVSTRRDVLLSLTRWEHGDRLVRETWLELPVDEPTPGQPEGPVDREETLDDDDVPQ
jgi:CRISPR system Cascade subunit CasD